MGQRRVGDARDRDEGDEDEDPPAVAQFPVGVEEQLFQDGARCRVVELVPTLHVNRASSQSRFQAASKTIGLAAQQPVKRNHVRDHEHGHIEDRDRICGAKLARVRREIALNSVAIVEDEIARPDEIEGDDKGPEKRTDPDRGESQHGQQPRREVATSGKRAEPRGQIRTHDARDDEREPEKAKAVQGGDGAKRLDLAQRLEPGNDIRADAQSRRDVAQDQLNLKNGFGSDGPFVRPISAGDYSR